MTEKRFKYYGRGIIIDDNPNGFNYNLNNVRDITRLVRDLNKFYEQYITHQDENRKLRKIKHHIKYLKKTLDGIELDDGDME